MKFDDVDPKPLPVRSHPSRGAWIEITLQQLLQPGAARRTPRGVRGLKWMMRSGWLIITAVAPLAGCVD